MDKIDDKEVGKLFDSAHKIITVLMAAGIGWMVTTVNQAAQDIAVLKVQVQSAVSDRYTATQAYSNNLLVEERFKEVYRRLRELEREKENGKLQ